jgi:hypothetical protein
MLTDEQRANLRDNIKLMIGLPADDSSKDEVIERLARQFEADLAKRPSHDSAPGKHAVRNLAIALNAELPKWLS